MSGAASRPRVPAPASYRRRGLAAPHAFADRLQPPPEALWRPQQVHGAQVVCADPVASVDPAISADRAGSAGSVYPVVPAAPSDSSDPAAPAMPRADAVWTTTPGRAVGVVTADCVPVLLRAGAPIATPLAVAAVHAGWRGLSAGVLERALDALHAACPGAPIYAAHGPAAGACCYEVDGQVCEALEARYPEALAAAVKPSRPGHVMLDLIALARAALHAAGALCLPCEMYCTICDLRFASYRRDGAHAGRMLHWIRLAEEPGDGRGPSRA